MSAIAHISCKKNVNANLMSNTLGVLARSPEPEAHDKVLDNNPDQIGIGNVGF